MNELRRVMLVSPVGDIGGGEEVLLALARHLPSFGYSADLICLRPGPLEDAANKLGVFAAAWQHHRMRDLRSVRAARRWLYDLVQQRQPHLLHCNHMAHLYGSGAARRAGVPEVWHIHDYPHRMDWADRLCRLISADHVIFTTPFVRSGYPILTRRYSNSVIPPAAPDLPTALRSPNDIRARFDLPAVGPIFLTATRLQSHKGHAVLLAAAKCVLEHNSAVTFVVTGSPSNPSQETYLSELRRLAGTLGVDRAVRFVGRIDEADLTALYAASDALVHPAITEGFGLALVNAMRGGLPVIAADAEGPRYVLDDGKLGVLIPRGDSGALADAILDMLRNPPSRDRLEEVAAIANSRFSPLNLAHAVSKVYDRIPTLSHASA
jgi:glycosyltransferase involved in cell wall biosynthesis